MRTTLRQLRYFAEIARSRSFSRAAANLGVAQPALSQNIATLESELGVQLFERHAKGVALSEAGTRLYDRALAILADVEGLKAQVAELPDEPGGLVRLSLAGSMSGVIAAPLIREVSARYPRILLTISDGMSSDTRRQVESGQSHLALMPSPSELFGMESSPLFEEHFMFFGSPATMRSLPEEIPLAEVFRHPLAAPDRAHDLRKILERAAAALDMRPNVTYELNSPQMLVSVVRDGLAFAVLPPGACKDAAASHAIASRPIAAPGLSRVQAVVWPREPGLTAAAAAVRGVLADVIAEAVGSGQLRGRLLAEAIRNSEI